MRALPPLAALLVLAACATPEEQCLRRATPDYSVIDTEIAEAEANIARGYRYDTRSKVTVGFDMCSQSGNVSLCLGGDRDLPQKPIPINVEAEKVRLAALRAQRAQMVEDSAAAMEACRAGS